MSTSEIRVALAGLGTVGAAVVRSLQEEGARYREALGVPLRLVLILDRSHQRKDTGWIDPHVTVTDSLEEFLQAPADIVVELIGGGGPADHIITTSLQQRKAVITANKLLLAQSARQYFELARAHNAYLGLEAAVAGGIPIIRVLRRSLLSDRIVRLRGILNGTCNFILSEMAGRGSDFQEVLAEAQARGYAEADPTLDVSGRDTADKLAILSLFAFGQFIAPDQVPTQGITSIAPVDFVYARRFDCAIKLLGVAGRTDGDVCLRVSPFLVSHRLTLSAVSGAFNAVEVTGARLGSILLSGKGAGGDPTAVSVVSDILNAALWMQEERRTQFQPVFNSRGAGADTDDVTAAATFNATETYPFYIRFFVNDRPGIIAAVATILARHQINIHSVVQEPWPDPSNLPFVITVEPTLSGTMEQAMSELKGLEFNTVPPLLLPILDQ
jgi:homoserine dehydrogenase